MALNNTQKKQLQRLMESNDWESLEAFLRDFMIRVFAQGSIKREDEFNTIWYAAEMEGGKRLLAQFFREMEEEAKNLQN